MPSRKTNQNKSESQLLIHLIRCPHSTDKGSEAPEWMNLKEMAFKLQARGQRKISSSRYLLKALISQASFWALSLIVSFKVHVLLRDRNTAPPHLTDGQTEANLPHELRWPDTRAHIPTYWFLRKHTIPVSYWERRRVRQQQSFDQGSPHHSNRWAESTVALDRTDFPSNRLGDLMQIP